MIGGFIEKGGGMLRSAAKDPPSLYRGDGLKTEHRRKKHLEGCGSGLNKALRLVQKDGCRDGDTVWL